MLYLVIMETVGTAPGDPVQHMEEMVIPYFEALMRLEAENKIVAGGTMVGSRASTFIVDVASNEELSRILQNLPLWGMQQVDVTPLQSFEDRAEQVREVIEKRKRAL